MYLVDASVQPFSRIVCLTFSDNLEVLVLHYNTSEHKIALLICPLYIPSCPVKHVRDPRLHALRVLCKHEISVLAACMMSCQYISARCVF